MFAMKWMPKRQVWFWHLLVFHFVSYWILSTYKSLICSDNHLCLPWIYKQSVFVHIFAFCERSVCKYDLSKYLTAQDLLSSPYRKMSLSSWLAARLDGVLCSDSLWSFFKKTQTQHVICCLSFTFHHKSRLRNKTLSVDWPCSRSSVWDTCCVCVCVSGK